MESERESLLPNSRSSPAMAAATKALSASTTLASSTLTSTMAASSTTVASSATLVSPLLGGSSNLASPTVTSTPLLASSSTVVERDEMEEVRLEEVVKLGGKGSGQSGGERSLPHSESRHSLQLGKHHAPKTSRQVRRQKSAQLPAHGEVQRMEQSLLRLLHQFNSGQLRAFDGSMLVQMEQVRDQQEAIARRHFELGAEQDLHPPLSDDGLTMACENMGQLMSSLETLSLAIGQLSSLDRLAEGRGASSQPEGREGSTMSSEPLYTRRFGCI